jgi:hypothetical protein
MDMNARIRAALAASPDVAAWLAGWRDKPRPRLAVIVPYRDRAEHWRRFLPHLISYFRRDKLDAARDPILLAVEQDDALPFNRGLLLNAGFLLAEPFCDYACFHDVDYLPLWADYAMPDRPTRIVWWGMHERPIRLGRDDLVGNAPRSGLGTVALFPNAQFRAVDGYSNRYRGWGFEDTDLAERCARLGIPVGQRDGTFLPLDHDSAGHDDEGEKSAAWLANEARFQAAAARYPEGGPIAEGLSTLDASCTGLRLEAAEGLDASETNQVVRLSVATASKTGATAQAGTGSASA